ncbi:hypothetical protein FOL47_001269 [Perkinsus chesapeaki]|uniref:Uncharacterized protein n=1 Tax=Perkinsus chesapeaki TaxID=330153 RepID=A0A7J6KTV9_PERCH|nr:hypothetical protein FOL47_001269 [Perkinsus chesapeaki]
MNPTLGMLYFSAVAVGLIKGDAVRVYNLTGVSDPIQQQLQRDDIIYRDYQDGDRPKYDCADHDEICYVAIDKSDSPHTVVGVIEMHIPDKGMEQELKELIMAKVPPSKRDGIIGYINFIFVMTNWRVATNLIEKKLTDIKEKMPKVVAIIAMLCISGGQDADNLCALPAVKVMSYTISRL